MTIGNVVAGEISLLRRVNDHEDSKKSTACLSIVDGNGDVNRLRDDAA